MKTLISTFCTLIALFSVNEAIAQLLFTDNKQSFGSFTNIAIGDIDGDKDLDIVALYYKSPNKIWFNNGTGNYTSIEGLGTKGNAVALADLDGDGDLDAFIVDGCYQNIGKPATVWMNDGKGNFTNSGQQLGSKYSTDVALADLDGDGDIDAFVCNHAFENNLSNGEHQIWLNDGKGNFTNSGQDLGNSYHTSVHLGDIEGDGDIDALVTANFNETGVTNENEIWINDGKANFTKRVLSNPYSNDLALADIDKDGDLDIVIVYLNYINNSNIGAKIYLNDGKGNFSLSAQSFDAVHYNGVELGDLNNDGNLDIMFANGKQFNDSPNRTWIGDGKGNFIKTDLSFGLNDGIFIKLADFNNDKRIDANVGNKIWFNTTTDYFGQTPPSDIPKKFSAYPSDSLPIFHSCPSFSPNGDEAFWATWPDLNNFIQTIYYTKKENGKWSNPSIAPFSGGKYSDKLPCFSGDGKRVYFTSDRPYSGNGNPIDENIWYIEKSDSGWSSPIILDNSVNSSQEDAWISVAANNNLYFGRDNKLYCAKWEQNHFLPSQALAINFPNIGSLGCIAPDESYIILQSVYVKNSSNEYIDDLYIIFQSNGEWLNPIKLDSKINSMKSKSFAHITSDGKYLFFLGDNNVCYWVSTNFIVDLKKSSLPN